MEDPSKIQMFSHADIFIMENVPCYNQKSFFGTDSL